MPSTELTPIVPRQWSSDDQRRLEVIAAAIDKGARLTPAEARFLFHAFADAADEVVALRKRMEDR
jgi:hypothetical protein